MIEPRDINTATGESTRIAVDVYRPDTPAHYPSFHLLGEWSHQ